MILILYVIVLILKGLYKLYNNIHISHKYSISKYIASRSFIYITDHHVNNPYSESSALPLTFPKKNGESIYIHTTALHNFVNNYLPKIKYSFVLLTGDTDKTIPDDYLFDTYNILEHPLLIHWYAQNCRIVKNKISQLPIGLDFHTLTHILSKRLSWGKMQTVVEQEQDIDNILSKKIQKINKCYSNFHFGINGRYTYDRTDAINKIPKELIYYEPNKVTRLQSWKNMVKYKYVVSPHGNGLDCHRTWEALILGCIPIVKTSSLDPMYDELPVLIVSDWSDITQELLDNFKSTNYNNKKLYMEYWIDLLNSYKNN